MRVGSGKRFSPDLCSWCVNQEMQLVVLYCGDLDIFRFILRQDSVHSTLCFGGEGLQACVAYGVLLADALSAVARSRCKQ